MKKFFTSLFAVLALFFVIDRIGSVMMSECIKKTNAKAEVKIRYLVENVCEDVVLLGTSRCIHHYIPSIIADSLHQSVYNGGISDSDNIYSHYILLNYMLTHHKPKVVCLELMPKDYSIQDDDSFGKISFFAPWIGLSERADSVYRTAGTYRNYIISHLYRYNAKGVEAIGGLVANHRYGEDHGYFRAEGSPNKSLRLEREEYPKGVDSLKLDYVQRFIDLCHTNDIRLVFTFSPRYSIAPPAFYAPLKDIAAKNGVPCLDYHSSGLFHDHPEYFRDSGHMLEEGAKAYSSIFARDLKRICKNKVNYFVNSDKLATFAGKTTFKRY